MQPPKMPSKSDHPIKPSTITSGVGFRFGHWLVFPHENKLHRGDQVVQIEPKVMQLLLTLVSRHNQACSRNDLLEQLWPSSDTSNSSLTRAISELRKALGDQQNPSQYIDTIHRIGYKAIAEIRPLIDRADITAGGSTTAGRLSTQEEVIAMARYLLVRRNESDILRAIRLLKECLEQNPSYAQLWAMLAHAQSILHLYSEEPAALMIRKADEHARKALELDGANGLAWAVLGGIAHYEWRWPDALEQFERAYAYQPQDPVILHGYAELSLHMGRIEDAQKLMRTACRLEPLAASAHLILGWMLLHGHEQQAGLELDKARRLGADTVFADNLECLLLHRAGWDEAAIRRWQRLNQCRMDHPEWLWPKYLLERIVDTRPGPGLVDNIRERVRLAQVDPGIAPFMLASAGAIDAAYEMSRAAVASQRFFIIDPWLKEMNAFRADVRFTGLLNQVGLSSLVSDHL